jgi:hypothetical protein
VESCSNAKVNRKRGGLRFHWVGTVVTTGN